MKRALTLIVLGGALSGLPALASEDRNIDADTRAQIRATLTGQGYEVRKIEAEDGMFEAYAIKDGQRLEIYMNEQMKIIRTERDD